MGNNITSFGGVTGQSDGVLIHISELLVNRYRLDLKSLGLFPETLMSPDGHVSSYPPTIEQADEAVSFGFSEAAECVIQTLYEEYCPKQVTLPQTVEFNGVAHMVSDKAQSMTNMRQDARFALVVQGVLGAVHESLDQQFPFLRLIDGESLKEIMLSTIPVGGAVDENYLSGRREMGIEAFNACRDNLRRHAGSDWVRLKTDHNLANRIQASVGIYTSTFGLEL